jgi:hypothetical protein
MSFVCLARFAQPSRLQLARIALEQAGLAVEVRGESRAVLVGELPDAGGELWVDEADVERAREVLRVAEQAGAEAGPERSCPACAAPNPAGFEADENAVFERCESFNRAEARIGGWRATAEGRFLEDEVLADDVRYRYSDPDGDEVSERLDISLADGGTFVQWRGPRGWQAAP